MEKLSLNNLHKFYFYVLVTSFLFTSTNLIFLSILLPLLLIFLIPFLFVSRDYHVNKISFYTFIFLFYSFISLISYNYQSLLNFNFYRYDGAFLIVLFPLIFFGFLRNKINFNVKKILTIFLIISLLINLPFVLFQLYEGRYIVGAFKSTNGFGGFIMSILAVAIFLRVNIKFKIVLILSFTVFLFLTLSRGSILGIGLGLLLCQFVFKKKYKYLILFILIIVLLQSLILVYTKPKYDEFKQNILSEVVNESFNTKKRNIYIRLYDNWPKSFGIFLDSPIFGRGVGSVNDYSFDISSDKSITYNSAHSHNVYLHVLAEQGILGLFLFIIIIYYFFIYLESKKSNDIDTENLRKTLVLILLALIFSSFTENRFFSPSNSLPFIYILMLYNMKKVKFLGENV